MNKTEKSNTLTKETQLLQKITTNLTQNKTNTFQHQIQLYGTINYTRTQYLPQLSKKITENPEHKNKFYNYTSLESMILDLLTHIESNTIKTIENQTKTTKTQEMIQYTTKLLKLLEKTLQNNKQEKITQQILKTQNQYYQLIYDQKADHRIK